MTESSKLIPSNVKAWCDSAIKALEDDNRALWNALSFIESFEVDSTLEASAYDAMKQQVSNFYTAINYLRTANDLDINDFNTLKSIVGDEELDGQKIFEAMELAKQEMQKYQDTITKYTNMANSLSADDETMIQSTKMVTRYEDLMEANQKIIDELQAKIDLYDQIDAQSGALFTNGQAIRQAGLTAIAETMKSGYVKGSYYTISNADIAQKTMGTLTPAQVLAYNSVHQRTPETVTYEKNYFEVENGLYGAVSSGDVTFVQGVEYSAMKRVNEETGSELDIAAVSAEAYGGARLKNDAGGVSGIVGEEVDMSFVRYTTPEMSYEGEINGKEFSISGTNTTGFGVLEIDSEGEISKGTEKLVDINVEGETNISAIKNASDIRVQYGDYVLDSSIEFNVGAGLGTFGVEYSSDGLEIETPWFEGTFDLSKEGEE